MKGTSPVEVNAEFFTGIPLESNVAEVVPHSASALHELHLLLVDFHYAAVGVGGAVNADDKAVAKRTNLIVVAYARHGTALRNDILKVANELKHFVLAHRVRIIILHARNFACYATMHVVGRFLEEIAE